MAHDNLIQQLRSKIDEAEKAMAKANDATKKSLSDLVKEMDTLVEKMMSDADTPTENFVDRVTELLNKVTEKIKGKLM